MDEQVAGECQLILKNFNAGGLSRSKFLEQNGVIHDKAGIKQESCIGFRVFINDPVDQKQVREIIDFIGRSCLKNKVDSIIHPCYQCNR
jgi:hypothetical protein